MSTEPTLDHTLTADVFGFQRLEVIVERVLTGFKTPICWAPGSSVSSCLRDWGYTFCAYIQEDHGAKYHDSLHQKYLLRDESFLFEEVNELVDKFNIGIANVHETLHWRISETSINDYPPFEELNRTVGRMLPQSNAFIVKHSETLSDQFKHKIREAFGRRCLKSAVGATKVQMQNIEYANYLFNKELSGYVNTYKAFVQLDDLLNRVQRRADFYEDALNTVSSIKNKHHDAIFCLAGVNTKECRKLGANNTNLDLFGWNGTFGQLTDAEAKAWGKANIDVLDCNEWDHQEDEVNSVLSNVQVYFMFYSKMAKELEIHRNQLYETIQGFEKGLDFNAF